MKPTDPAALESFDRPRILSSSRLESIVVVVAAGDEVVSPRETGVTVKVVGEDALVVWRGVFSVSALARRLSDCAGRVYDGVKSGCERRGVSTSECACLNSTHWVSR